MPVDRFDQGPGDHGPGDHGPGDHGPGDHGPGDHGPGDHGPGLSAEDLDRVTALLGRVPAADVSVVLRREDGEPSVIANPPFLRDGTPMPTRFWLVDPVLRPAVSRLEAEGGVRAAEREVDPAAVAAAHTRYAELRDREVAAGHVGPRPSGGVGGTRAGVKCLHAHLAWWLVGGDDPVGEWVARRLGVARPGSGDGA